MRMTHTTTATTDYDSVYRRAWGFSVWAWATLSDTQRAYYRDHITSAPMLEGAFK